MKVYSLIAVSATFVAAKKLTGVSKDSIQSQHQHRVAWPVGVVDHSNDDSEADVLN